MEENAKTTDFNDFKTDINQAVPKTLDHIIGQKQVIDTLRTSLKAYFNDRSTSGKSDLPYGPVLFVGPAGTGKSLVAEALHAELGNFHMIERIGETLRGNDDLYSILVEADENTTIFIDESQGISPANQHILLKALSEKRLCVPRSKSANVFHTIPLSNYLMILATTHEYHLQDALRNRVRIYCRFVHYCPEDMVEIVRQRATALKWKYESDEVLRLIAERAKGTPRLALNRNLAMCWSVTRSENRAEITVSDAHNAFKLLDIDHLGLDKLERTYLQALKGSGKSCLNTISSMLSLPPYTIQKVIEPYLFKQGLVNKDRACLRTLTDKGRDHLEKVE